ncbi:hypothetical protein DEJ23_07020 [Curtobacterium sp. MCSS17_008]|uniref:hypothetical protein n=1 Tax=Curtobacterium sp. MCSS17_008 TaxID=2175647 RepID=UPI000DA9F3B6|nr:hypothetical protein [Curtobacterium sp. MCSS17_008]PZF57245.1 hypothetical protein DEJ23_07020 [Curtobacterium sp. MCSS17_008]
MTTFTTPDALLNASSASAALAPRTRRSAQRSPFSEVREQARQRTLMLAATATGIVSVTVAASAAVVLGLSA